MRFGSLHFWVRLVVILEQIVCQIRVQRVFVVVFLDVCVPYATYTLAAASRLETSCDSRWR